jgi:hypothetical protein
VLPGATDTGREGRVGQERRGGREGVGGDEGTKRGEVGQEERKKEKGDEMKWRITSEKLENVTCKINIR